jgi:hypothetical protein
MAIRFPDPYFYYMDNTNSRPPVFVFIYFLKLILASVNALI